MPGHLYKRARYFSLVMMVLAVTGCAPGPPPPVPPGLFSACVGWMAAALLIWCAVLLWKNLSSNRKTRKDSMADALKAIDDRIAAVEKKMNRIEKSRKHQKRRML